MRARSTCGRLTRIDTVCPKVDGYQQSTSQPSRVNYNPDDGVNIDNGFAVFLDCHYQDTCDGTTTIDCAFKMNDDGSAGSGTTLATDDFTCARVLARACADAFSNSAECTAIVPEPVTRSSAAYCAGEPRSVA